MYKKIMIDGNEMEFVANAATPFRFKQVFHKDLLSIFSSEESAQSQGVEAVTELAYIMARQAEKADMSKLSYDDFIAWLEGYAPMAFVETAEDILSVYTGTTESTSIP